MKALPEPNGSVLMKSFCGGSRGAVFSKRAPLADEKRIVLFDTA
jgi:hypothetical protein